LPEKITTLEALADRIRSLRPPHITALIEKLGNYEYYAIFIELIEDFLPEHRGAILQAEEPCTQMAMFARLFENKHFALWPTFQDGAAEGYSELTMNIPVVCRGFGYQEYSNMVQDGYDHGEILMSFFFEHPWNDDGERVALSEQCANLFDSDQLKRIPDGGFTTEQMHKYLDGTPYAPLAAWGDIINLATGNEFLDTDDENLSQTEMPQWGREQVEYLTQQWNQANQIEEPVYEMMKKFTNHPHDYFFEVMNFIDKKRGLIPDQPTRQEQLANGQLEMALDVEEETNA
jgi:hypothetical protein